MPDRENVIKGLREMSCRATWKDIDRIRHRFQPIINDAIALLKEQETMMQCIKGKCRICPHCLNCDVDENGLLIGETRCS